MAGSRIGADVLLCATDGSAELPACLGCEPGGDSMAQVPGINRSDFVAWRCDCKGSSMSVTSGYRVTNM